MHFFNAPTLLVLSSAATGLASIQKRQNETMAPGSTLDENESVLSNAVDPASLNSSSYYYSHGDGVAGRNRSMAQWTADRWSEGGFDSYLVEYNVYLNYPVSKNLSLHYANGSTFLPQLEEDILEEDSVTSYPNRIPTFHGFSATGSVEAEYIYVGQAGRADFERLVELGVELEGKIALAKYGAAFRGLKVQNAQNFGMIGVVMFNDPADDGEITEENGYEAYPDGPARNPTYVQRGSVMFLSTNIGDPTTPGYPSKGKNVSRADPSGFIPSIPSLPISWLAAEPFLAALDGYGIDGETVNRTGWVGALPVDYSTGPAPGAVIALENVMDDGFNDVWNAVGVINGTEQDEVIIIGNHRDSWMIGGAVDPNSGSSVLVEMSKAFGELLSTGWQPRRTIVLASWDAEEYGLIGSTEWVEEYVPWLTESAVTYINIDTLAAGPDPSMSATPELHDIAIETMKKVPYNLRGQEESLYDAWFNLTEGQVGVLGSGSDYTPFLHRGIASIDISGNNGPQDPIPHYHSNYDTYYWMTTFGDPEYLMHKAMTQWTTLLTYHLANDAVIPYNVLTYETELETYYSALSEVIASSGYNISTNALRTSIDNFNTQAQALTTLAADSLAANSTAGIALANHKFKSFHRGFTSQGGLPTREFFRHVLFAPGLDTGYAPVTFPGITEAITEYENATMARDWVARTAAGIDVAAGILKP
ncbi:hypothetical protein MBLNU230_g0556t1 [Neophaeotheca triangularis]